MPHSDQLLKAVHDLAQALQQSNETQTIATLDIQQRVSDVEWAAVKVAREQTADKARIAELERRDAIRASQIRWGYVALIVLIVSFGLALLIASVR
jgi:hypothetical protein